MLCCALSPSSIVAAAHSPTVAGAQVQQLLLTIGSACSCDSATRPADCVLTTAFCGGDACAAQLDNAASCAGVAPFSSDVWKAAIRSTRLSQCSCRSCSISRVVFNFLSLCRLSAGRGQLCAQQRFNCSPRPVCRASHASCCAHCALRLVTACVRSDFSFKRYRYISVLLTVVDSFCLCAAVDLY